MEISEILDGLDHWDEEEVPAELLLAAVKAKDEITSDLIIAIENVAKNPARHIDDPNHRLYYWAIYLLTHFAVTDAFPAIVKLFKLNGTDFSSIVSDIIAKDGAMILANICGGNIEPICKILRDTA